jgi:hypothetical protein
MAFDSAQALEGGASKPHLTGEAYEMMTNFLMRVLDSDTYREVERQLGELLDQQEAAQPTAPTAGAADRRRVATDSAGERSFLSRFPSARKIGFA